MKKIFLAVFLLLSQVDEYFLIHAQCYTPPASWYRTITTSTYKWYWDGNLNNAPFRSTSEPGVEMPHDEAVQLVKQAIRNAVDSWKSAVNSKGIVISNMDETTNPDLASFKIFFMDMGDYTVNGLADSPNPTIIYVNTNRIDSHWFTGNSLIVPEYAYDIYTIMQHEMGHIFMGLGHSDGMTSIMARDAAFREIRGLDVCDRKIVLSYYYPYFNIPIDNNFTDNTGNSTHGKMQVNGTEYTVPYTLPDIPNGTTLSLTAVTPQIDNAGYQRIWYTGSEVNKSYWEQFEGNLGSNQTYTHSVTFQDDGNVYKANYNQFNPTTSGNIYQDQVWYAPVTLTDNVTVINGSILTICPGVTVDLTGHSIINNVGTITNQGTISGLAATTGDGSLFSTIQSAINHASYYDNVMIPAGTFNGDATINNKVLSIYGQGPTSTTINGTVWFENCSGGQLNNLTSNYTDLDNCYNVNTWNHKIITGEGLYTYNSTDLDISCTTSYPGDYALAFTYYSSGLLDNSQLESSYVGTSLYNYSNFTISSTTFCSNSLDIQASYYSSADASSSDNIFSSYPAPVSDSVSLPSSYSTCGMPKSSVIAASNAKIKITDEPAYKAFEQLMNSYNKLSNEVRQDTKQNGKFNKDKFTGRYTSIIDSMKSFIKSNPNSNWSKTVMATAVGCYKKLNDFETMKKFLDETLSDKNLSLLSGLSKRFMIDYYNNQKDYSHSLSLADEIIKEHQGDKDLLCDVQFEKGLLYQYSLSNNDEAIKCYNEILTNYPDNVLTKPAKRHLKSLGVAVKENGNKLAVSTENNLSLDNYPNPFNPTTTISYTLKQKDHVILTVFDILGKEVARLVDQIQTEGEHSVSFDGSSLASGMYIYQLKGTNFNITKKMLLLK